VLCYDAFQYLDADAAQTVLSELRARVPTIERVVLGNLPDKERAALFFGDRLQQEEPDLTDPRSQIGIWWGQDELRAFAAACGWTARFSQLPTHVFNAHYRYDAILLPAD